MNIENVGATYFLVKSIYDHKVSQIPKNERIGIGRKSLRSAITELDFDGGGYSGVNFAAGAAGFFVTLENIIKNEGKRGLRGWRTGMILIPDEEHGENRIYGMAQRSEVALTLIEQRCNQEYITSIIRDRDGEISAYLGTTSEVVNDTKPTCSTRYGTEQDDLSIAFLISKLGTAFLDSLTMPRISKHEHFFTPQEKAKSKLIEVYQKWSDAEIADVPELFAFATEIGNALEKIVLTYGSDSKELKLPRRKSNHGGDAVSLSLSESGSVLASRSFVSRTGYLNKGINEGDQIDLRRVSPDAPIDILNGRANQAGYSARIAIASTDLHDPNVEHAAAAIKRIAETTLALI